MHASLARVLFEQDVEALRAMLENRRWTLNSAVFPIIDVTFEGSRPLRMRLDCESWDSDPPSGELLNADGTPLSGPIPGGQFHAGPHPGTGRPFVCMRGFREFHTHPSHLNEVWDAYRGQDGMNLPGLLDQVSRSWRRLVGK